MENRCIEMANNAKQFKTNQSPIVKNFKVDIVPKLRRNDFVLVKYQDSKLRVAKIRKIIHDSKRVSVIWHISPYELPKNTKYGDVNFHKRECIEDGCMNELDTISLKTILSVCKVYETIHEFDSAHDPMAYVCRYKLVKETIYKLVPISCERRRQQHDNENHYTDSETQSEAEYDLNGTIEKLRTSILESNDSNDQTSSIRTQLVSPLKIVKSKGALQVKRDQRQSMSSKKRSSPVDTMDDNQDVSPSKRNKRHSHINDDCVLDSPDIGTRKFSSPAQKDMNKIRKNLNDSFTGASFPMDDDATYQIVKEVDLKVTLRKDNKKEPLKEHNENTAQIPFNGIVDSARYNTRRSILKNPENARDKESTPKRSVRIREETLINAHKAKMDVELTPRRQSRRLSSLNAAQLIKVNAEDTTPEADKPNRIKPKNASAPSTPKTAAIQLMATPQRTSRSTRTPATPKTPKGVMTPQQKRSEFRSGNLTPSIQSRQESIGGHQTELELIRERLQVSAVPTSLPCREKEFASIYEFIVGKLNDGTGGCIYISGVPGTGKTATVTQVIKNIQSESKPKKMPAFDFVDINGMRLTEPRQAYVQIYRQLTGKTLAWAQARELLETRFMAGSRKSIRPTVLLVDELDIICNRKQDVVYNLFDWTVRKGARLIAITIANTMDLPERVLKLKVASRLGLTRITFQPYTFKQLQEVVMTRLAGSDCFMADAVQLVARKVASVSGDCRRALDICRRATEIAEENDGQEKQRGKAKKIEVNFAHINQALSEMFASPKVRAIKNCTKFEKLFLQAVASEITRTGIEEVEFQRVYWQIGTLAPVLGIKNPPAEDQAMIICMALAANRLLIAEDSSAGLYLKIILNATVDDLYYALNVS